MNGNNFANRIRLSCPKKSIWLYTGYTVVSIDKEHKLIIFDRNETIQPDWYWLSNKAMNNHYKRMKIASMCDVLIDGQYIDSQRDITLPYRGSKNQRVINIQESLKQDKIVLYCE